MNSSLVPTEMLEAEKYELQNLSERHKTVASLLAQGLPRAVVAEATKYEPEYVTWLQRQPVFKQYMKNMLEASQGRLDAIFEQSVEVIADTLRNGTEDGKLRAAKLQLEATGRVGKHFTPGDGSTGTGLDKLADRLVVLMHEKRKEHNGEVYEGRVTGRTEG